MTLPLAYLTLAAIGGIVLLWLLGARRSETIYAPDVGLLYRDGQFVRELGPGRHMLFDPGSRIRIVRVNAAPTTLRLAETTLVSADQFAFKVGLSPTVRITDARAFHEAQPIAPAYSMSGGTVQAVRPAMRPTTVSGPPDMQAQLSAAAILAAAAMPLKEIIAAPATLAAAARTALTGSVPGVDVVDVLVTSITLPPETRRMFTDVERARQEALASLERARGEQASLRALANAARLLADNPALGNLRFLQTLEQTPGPKTIVLGQGGLMADVGATRASPRPDTAD
ncbi:hypothetical protein GCM10022280_12020 [Sphingomonas swuensis]|uniref:Band 7 domain-containing protein n=1 Tax=Sphingomonas swuensis TaxID=977800 RepID=A0ABP7SR22_9SPHN